MLAENTLGLPVGYKRYVYTEASHPAQQTKKQTSFGYTNLITHLFAVYSRILGRPIAINWLL